MSDINALYQEMILDHNKNPRNFGQPEGYTHFAEGYNPLCGDHINIYVKLEDGVIRDIHFSGKGCAISKSSASIMTEVLKGKSIPDAKKAFSGFQQLVTAPMDESPDLASLGKLAVFAGVKEFPSRIKCASLAWHTMVSAIEGTVEKSVSTE
jgi:nitrogen fixation NifU-like protein